MTKKEFLIDQLKEKINFLDKDSKRHKSMHRRLRYALFFLTALSSVLAGYALYQNKADKNAGDQIALAIVVTTALSSLVTAIEGLRKPAELWIHERKICYALVDLKREIEYGTLNEDNENLDKQFGKLQGILELSAKDWTVKVSDISAAVKPKVTQGTGSNTP